MAYDPANPFGNNNTNSSPYDAVRKQAVQNSGNDQAQGLDAITRRFAAMGNLNSGSYVQAQNDNSRNAQNSLNSNLSNIDTAEQGQALPYKQLAFQQSQLGEQQKEFGVTSAQKSREIDLEAQQQNLDQQANQINQGFGQWQMQHSGGLLGGGGFLGTGIGA